MILRLLLKYLILIDKKKFALIFVTKIYEIKDIFLKFEISLELANPAIIISLLTGFIYYRLLFNFETTYEGLF